MVVPPLSHSRMRRMPFQDPGHQRNVFKKNDGSNKNELAAGTSAAPVQIYGSIRLQEVYSWESGIGWGFSG